MLTSLTCCTCGVSVERDIPAPLHPEFKFRCAKCSGEIHNNPHGGGRGRARTPEEAARVAEVHKVNREKKKKCQSEPIA